MDRADLLKLVNRARTLQIEIEASNGLRKELEEITQILVDNVSKHDLALVGCVVVDTFSEKNLQWKSVAFRRFELAIAEEPIVNAPHKPRHKKNKNKPVFRMKRSA